METEQKEYKKSLSQIKEGIISIVSILNKHGFGELFFGLDASGNVYKQDVNEKSLRDLSQRISNHIEPRIYPVIENNKGVVKITFYRKSDDLKTSQKPVKNQPKTSQKPAKNQPKLSPEERKKLILKDIKQGVFSKRKFAEKNKVNKSTVESDLKCLKKKKIILFEGVKKGGKWKILK